MSIVEDYLMTIVDVHFGGAKEYLLLYVEGRSGNSALSVGDESLDVSVSNSLLGWTNANINGGVPAFVDKVTAPPGDEFTPVPHFDQGKSLTHAFPVNNDQRTKVTTEVFHVLDRGEYNLIDRITGQIIPFAVNGLSHVKVPFQISWNGDSSGAFPPDLYTAPPGSGALFTTNVALAIAIDCGIGGVNWDCNFIGEIQGHDELTSVSATSWLGDRLIWINWSALQAKMKRAKQASTTFKVRFAPNSTVIGGKKSFYGYSFLTRYLTEAKFKAWPLKENITLDQFMDLLQHDAAPVPGRTEWSFNTPLFFPPNSEHLPPIQRLPVAGLPKNIATGEAKKGPGFFIFTITAAGNITVGPAQFEF